MLLLLAERLGEPFEPGRFTGSVVAHTLVMSLLLTFLAHTAHAQIDGLAQADRIEEEVVELYKEGRYVEAIPKAREVLALRELTLGPIHADVATSLSNLALLHERIGDPERAKPFYERAISIREQVLGPSHPALVASLDSLATLLWESREFPAARRLLERAVKIRETNPGDTHPDVAESLIKLAGLLKASGDYSGAMPLLERALKIREQVLGPTHPEVAQSLSYLASLLRTIGKYGEARSLYKRALAIREQALGSMHPDVATTLGNLGSLLQDMGDYAGAKPLFERALDIRERILGPTHPDVAQSLHYLGIVLRETKDYAAARPLFERALKIHELTHGPNNLSVATSLDILGLLLLQTGDYVGAQSRFERSLRIRERALDPNDPLVALSLDLVGVSFQFGNDYLRARPLHERALGIRRNAPGPGDLDLARNLNALGVLLWTLGDYTTARGLYEQALNIQEQHRDSTHPADMATSLQNLAELFRTLGDYATARSLHERALKRFEQALGPHHPFVALNLNNLAGLFVQLGDYAGARTLYERALRIREDALGPTDPEVATSLHDLANVLRAVGDYEAARLMYERALRIWKGAVGPMRINVASGLYSLAYLLRMTGDLGLARKFYEESLSIREEVLGPSHPDVAISLSGLAALLQAMGDSAAARPLYERALRISQQALGPTHPQVAVGLENFALLDWNAGRVEAAFHKLGQALTIAHTHIAQGLVGLSHRQKLAFLEHTTHYTDTFLSLPNGLVPTGISYRAVLERKNLLLRILVTERSRIEANPRPEVMTLSQEYTAIRQRLSALTIGVQKPADPEQYRRQISTLSQRLEEIEADLSRASATFRQTRAEESAGPGEVCAAVSKDTALIDLVSYRHYTPPPAPGKPASLTPAYVAFVLRGGECQTPVRVDLGPAAPIDEDVRRLRDALSRDTPEPGARELRARYQRTLAARLHAKLFPPALQQAIAGKPRLLIAPDGALALLPFALLPGEDGHEFLLETRTISYVPSGRDLLRTALSHPAPTGLLALGAPTFDHAPARVAQATTYRAGCGTLEDPFTPLPGTAAEVRAITRVYQQSNPTSPAKLLEGVQATKAALLEQAPEAKVLHLATHAYFAGEDCTPVGLVSEQRGLGGEPPAFLGHNPLLLAGIALSGANEREKADGILTALEVTALDLRGTELVVLSACDTGLGTPARGQELLGLRWAFAYAGAQHLVTSLWSVPDAETATLMTHFYTAMWQQGISVPAALRAAQLEMLRAARAKGDSAPHTWGAFVASGRAD